MLKIGSHVSFSDKGLLTAATEAKSYGSSSFMIYTGAPQNTRRKPIESMFIEEGKLAMQECGIEEIVVHAPYIINLGSYKPNTYELAVSFLQEEIRRTHAVGVKNIVLHPGAYTDKDAEYGIDRIAEGLNEVLGGTDETEVHIALETMAGKGTEMGRSFEEIASIIDKVKYNDRLAICLDTCHIHDAGYDIVDDLDGVLEKFDQVIGLDRLTVVHINDSKTRAARPKTATPRSEQAGSDTMRFTGSSIMRSSKAVRSSLRRRGSGRIRRRSVLCMRSKSRCCAVMWSNALDKHSFSRSNSCMNFCEGRHRIPFVRIGHLESAEKRCKGQKSRSSRADGTLIRYGDVRRAVP